MKVLIAPTEDFIKRERDAITADVSAGASAVISVINSINIAVNDFIVVGTEGSESAEICQVTAVTATTITVATLLLSHKKDESITKYKYNKRKFYGSTTSDGSFTELTGDGSPKTIMVNNPQGTLLEYTGGEGYVYFKSTYYNSQSAEESNIADAEVVYSDDSLRYCSLYAIRKQAGLTNNPFITDGILETYRKRAENEVRSYIMAKYILPLTEIPALIEHATVLLAAGYMDYQEFGRDGEGVKWLGEGRGILNSIKKGSQYLIGADETELPTRSTVNTVQGYPDSVDNNNGPIRMFTTKQRF